MSEQKESIYPIWRHHKNLESVIVQSEEEDKKLHAIGYRPTFVEVLAEEVEPALEPEKLDSGNNEPELSKAQLLEKLAEKGIEVSAKVKAMNKAQLLELLK